MTMITFLTGLVHAVLFLALLVHLRPALGFISGVGVGDANNISCLEGERQALLEFKKGLVDDYGKLSSWRSEDENKNCCNWEGVLCNNQTGHVVELHLGVEFPPLRADPSWVWIWFRNVILREAKSTDPASLPSRSSAKSRPSWKSKSAKENAPPFDLTSIPSESKPSPAMVAKLKSPLPPRPPPSKSHKTKLSIESHGLDVGNC
nr:hypothetical protein CFP56_10646 [Quercus suber]